MKQRFVESIGDTFDVVDVDTDIDSKCLVYQFDKAQFEQAALYVHPRINGFVFYNYFKFKSGEESCIRQDSRTVRVMAQSDYEQFTEDGKKILNKYGLVASEGAVVKGQDIKEKKRADIAIVQRDVRRAIVYLSENNSCNLPSTLLHKMIDLHEGLAEFDFYIKNEDEEAYVQ